ncbi:MAG: sigma-70 family RNA polymerase sigma factor [Phycisphaerales bacterium]|nr:sigma-70 family RNA polymerase sigma factor [Phycisphaerales bacterium]
MESPRAAAGRDTEADHAAVEAARAGDRAAFARLHERFAPMVHGILLAHAGPREADDLVQEVFLRAMRSIGTLRDAAAVGGWLAAIARNTAASAARAGPGPAPLSNAPEPAARPRGDALTTEDVMARIRELPEAYRETLLLRLAEGMPGPRIAERLGLTEGSVRVNLSRGMKLLRQRLGWEDGP